MARRKQDIILSDTIRDLLRGNNDSGTTLGYVSGATGKEEAVRDAFMARTWWTWNPTQIINYASCHDNYTADVFLRKRSGEQGQCFG